MTSFQEILNKVKKKKSSYLKSIILGEQMFPWNIPVNKKETGNLLLDTEILTTLYSNSKNTKNRGYRIESKTLKRTQITKLSKIIIDSEEDFIYLLKEEREINNFKNSINIFRDNFDSKIIDDYLMNNRAFIYNSSALFIDNFIEVSKFLIENPSSNKYPRELELKADTKFLSNNIQRITTFIRYFRELDDSCGKYKKLGLINPFSTLSIRLGSNFNVKANGNSFEPNLSTIELEAFSSFDNTYDKIFVIENRTSFLKFPLEENELAIYMGGFAINILKDIPFLLKANLFYFGDLDEHGFEILSLFREMYPNTKSFCMDIETIEKYRDFLIMGKEYTGIIKNLDSNETLALDYLISHKINGYSSRIEQEKISLDFINYKLKEIN